MPAAMKTAPKRGRPVTTGTTPPKDRAAKSRADRAAAGGGRLSMNLTPQGAEDIAAIRAENPNDRHRRGARRALRLQAQSLTPQPVHKSSPGPPRAGFFAPGCHLISENAGDDSAASRRRGAMCLLRASLCPGPATARGTFQKPMPTARKSAPPKPGAARKRTAVPHGPPRARASQRQARRQHRPRRRRPRHPPPAPSEAALLHLATITPGRKLRSPRRLCQSLRRASARARTVKPRVRPPRHPIRTARRGARRPSSPRCKSGSSSST